MLVIKRLYNIYIYEKTFLNLFQTQIKDNAKRKIASNAI